MPEAEALRRGKAIVSGRGAVAYDGQLARRRPLHPTYALRLVVDRDRTARLASVRPDDTTRTEPAVLRAPCGSARTAPALVPVARAPWS